MVFRAGSLLGLTLGGFVLGYMDWKWLFRIYAPVGLASKLRSGVGLGERYGPNEKPMIDSVGFLTFTSSISLILPSLTPAGTGNARASILLTSLGSALLMTFYRWEMKFPSPALDMRLFRSGSSLAAS